MKSKLRPRCFFDIDIGHSPAGRIVFELYDDICPRTAENFLKLCTGDSGMSETSGKKLHYLHSIFHRVIKGFMIQGGDFVNGDGTGGESIYGGRFNDENLEISHDKPFLLSMANCGPNTNGSQFFITTKPAIHLDGKHVVFGHAVSGENLIESIENLPVNANNKPVVEATISNCGVLIPVRKKKIKKQKLKEESVDSSSSKGKKKKKSKKKKHRNKRKTKTVKEDEIEAIYPKCSVRPDEIPEVPKPFFLYRGNLKNENPDDNENKEMLNSSQYVSKDIIGRSGRLIKGRGQLRYYSKSPCDRFDTPPHWKQETYKVSDNIDNRGSSKRKSPSANPTKEIQTSRQRKEKQSPRQSFRNNDNDNIRDTKKQGSPSREKRKRYDVWKDTPDKNDDRIKRSRRHEELKEYGDIDKIDKENLNKKNHNRKRSSSLDRIKPLDREKNNVKSIISKNNLPDVQQDKVDKHESKSIIYPYGDESDDSLKHKRLENPIDPNVSDYKSKNPHKESSDKNEEIKKKSNKNNHNDNSKVERKRSSSYDNYRRKSKSPTKRTTHSPPAHLVAKWQNRREKIMIRRSSLSRSNERHQSHSRYSPRKRSSRYSKSPNSERNKGESKQYDERNVSDNVCKISIGKSKDRSSSGTMDSSLSSAGSSVSNRPCRIDSELSDAEKTVNTQCWINHSAVNPANEGNKEKKSDNPITVVDKPKEEIKTDDNSTEKEAIMVIKPPEKTWLTNQWKTEEEEAIKKNAKIANNSILAKLREDDQKKKSQENPTKSFANNSESHQGAKRLQSPVSQSISKYRSPSGTKSSDNESSGSSSSSSRSYSRKRSSRRSKSRSRSFYRRRYRSPHYYRRNRRSTSRSGRRFRSRSYSRNSRRYGSRSSSTSRSSHYRSSRQNYRGLGFRRPSGSPRPRK